MAITLGNDANAKNLLGGAKINVTGGGASVAPAPVQASQDPKAVEAINAFNQAQPEPNQVAASTLSQPTSPVTVPRPAVASTMPVQDGVVSNVEQNITDLQAKIAEEEKALKERQNEYAALSGGDSMQDVLNQTMSQFGVPQNMERLAEIQTQLAKRATDSGITQTRIAGAAGQTLAQGQREITQEQREEAVRSAGLAAQASVLQGNIDTATQLVSQAVETAYQDRMLESQNLINQIDFIQNRVDAKTSERLEERKRQYQNEQLDMANAISSVNSAVASGFASEKDVATMTSLSGNPKAQKEYADKIIARATRTAYQQRMAAANAAAASASAGAANDAVAYAKETAAHTSEAMSALEEIRSNPLGIKASTGSTWLGRTALSAGLDAGAAGFVGGTVAGGGAGLIGGPLAPVTVPGGGAMGGVLGFAAGLTGGTVAAAGQRTDALSALSFLVNDATFSEMRRLKQSGVTFGSLTEGERIAIGKAADELFSALEVSPSGAVTTINTTEDRFYELMDNYEEKLLTYQAEANRLASGISDEDLAAIDAIK